MSSRQQYDLETDDGAVEGLNYEIYALTVLNYF